MSSQGFFHVKLVVNKRSNTYFRYVAGVVGMSVNLILVNSVQKCRYLDQSPQCKPVQLNTYSSSESLIFSSSIVVSYIEIA